MTRKQKRLSVIAGALAFLGAATALTFYALGQKASFFYMPAELQAATLEPVREEQGVIAEGSFGPDGVFVADSVLAKHDETYMPKEVADSLKAKGVWQETK
jgi:cytochrome c-type biogenesis protein CcmE